MGGDDDGAERRAAAQIPFDLPVYARHGLAEFLPSPANAAALSMVLQWPAWPSQTMLLVGPPGSGKTHLLAIWSARAQAMQIPANAIPAPRLLDPLRRAFALDNVDAIADEAALFHFLNHVSETGASLLMTASRAPDRTRFSLPDLLSRLRRAPALAIGAPDDALIVAVLEKLFRDRQLSVEPSVVGYIAMRLERSLDAARRFVEALDRESLAQGRPVTRPLAGELLERLRED
jgi:chromosomal replication initiation ATPase DnaA